MVYHFQKRWRLKFRRDPDAGLVLFIGPLVVSFDVHRGEVSQPRVLSVKRSEWRALSPEAQAKLEQITGALPRSYYRQQAEGREKLADKTLD